MAQRPYLYIDGSKKSEEARQICDAQGLNYSIIDLRDFASTDVTAPRLVTEFGRLESLDRIEWYVKYYKLKDKKA